MRTSTANQVFWGLALLMLAGCAGMGGMGTGYGTGGMEEGLHMGGWGDGYGGTWGHAEASAASNPLDNDPHYTANYQNKAFTDGRGTSYYHPAANSARQP